MNRLALRLLRPYLIAAAGVTAAAVAVVWHAAGVVQRQLAGAGVPDCLDPNVCYPHGEALDAVFTMEFTAASVPSLLGLILGVGLFAPERQDDTAAFALTRSASRRQWVHLKLAYALTAGILCAATVATVHRLVATRYTVLANDTYEGLQLLHLNNIGYMTAQTVLIVTLGAALGLAHRSTLRTLALTILCAPFALLAAAALALPVTYVLSPFAGAPAPSTFLDDLFTPDPFAYATSAVVAAAAAALALLVPRIGTRQPR